jgi:Flp pilus assembly CpaE family ATPase
LPLVIDKLRAAFDYLIVDIGRNLSRISRIVIDESELLVMVLSPIPAVVENTRAVLESLEEEGISGTRFFILTNRPVGAENMSSEALENILGREVNAGVPRMGQPFTLANTLHVPLHLRFPDDATTLIIQGVSVSIQERLQENEQIFGRP